MTYVNLREVRSEIAAGCLLCLLSATGIPACDGSSKKQSDAGPAKPTAAGDFAGALAAAYCTGLAACCKQAGYDSTSCRVTLEAQMGAIVTVNASNPKHTYDEAAAGDCIAALGAAASACTDQALSRQINRACQLVFRGNVPMGGSCGQDGDCIVPANGGVGCDSGVCVASPGSSSVADMTHGMVGEACAGTCEGNGYMSQCSYSSTSTATALCWAQDGVYCESGACVATPDIGQPCAFGPYCGANAYCTSGGLCAASLATGPCSSSYDCLSPSYCDSNSGQCTPAKANGATCNLDYECSGGQCELSLCRNWTMANAGACAGLLE